MAIPKNNRMIPHAKSMRKNMTKEERHLWYDFLRYCTPRFRRQEVIGNYIVDFYCHQAKIAIELDGSGHYEPDAAAYDAARTAYLNTLGIEVYRYSNADINYKFQGVCEHILFVMESCGTHPSVTFGDSSPQGEP